jgi:hypothetical protein
MKTVYISKECICGGKIKSSKLSKLDFSIPYKQKVDAGLTSFVFEASSTMTCCH